MVVCREWRMPRTRKEYWNITSGYPRFDAVYRGRQYVGQMADWLAVTAMARDNGSGDCAI